MSEDRERRGIKRWLTSPAMAFLAIGVLLYAVQALLSERRGEAEANRIQVTATEVGLLADRWTRQWNRPPTEQELRGLVDDYVRQEVLYREALTLGLDRGDEVIRRRLVQKYEFLTEDLAAQLEPSDAALQAYFQENRERYRFPERRSFRHVYFNLDRRGEAGVAQADTTLAELRADPDAASPDAASRERGLGDPFMLSYEYRANSPQEVEREFGRRFAEAVFQLEPGSWQGPVLSSYGLHLVIVTDVEESSLPRLDQVMGYVLADYQREVRERAQEEVLAGLMERYEVEIDEASIQDRALRP